MSDLPGFGSFADPIVGGESVLVRDAIRSRNYVATISGWSINKDGTAEFSSITIRGTAEFGPDPGQHIELTSSGEIKIYDASNVLVMQLDGSGFLVQDVATGASALLTLAAGVTVLALQPPTVVGHTFGSAFVYGDSNAGGDAWMSLVSPIIDAGSAADIKIYGQNASLGFPSQIFMTADEIYTNGAWPVGKGPVARAYSAVDSAAVTAETVVLTASSAVYETGRAYRVTFGPMVLTSNANGRPFFRLRKTNAVGQLLGESGIPVIGAAGNFHNAEGTFYFSNVSGANITAFIVLTLANLDGGPNTATQSTGGAAVTRWLLIEDVGVAAAYDWAINIV